MDLLRLPIAGTFLRWRHARTTLQMLLLVVAVAIVAHGLAGPDLASTNLATVLTWVQARGLFIVALLVAGNLFCAGCPFIRVRDWGRRLHAPRRAWPAWLRGKWIAVVLFAAVLVAYEYFDLWSLPAATAWIVLGYFAAALSTDLVFRGASFCQHVCPIGQFNFITSTTSPLELRVREVATCGACRTADCVSGRWDDAVETVAVGTYGGQGLQPLAGSAGAEAPALHRWESEAPALRRRGSLVQRGCELGLFLPAKVGNLDCTFCLDCVQACPHDNIALATRVPGAELADDGRRSVIGRLADRNDLAALVVVFVFGAFVNAAMMVAPVHHALQGHMPLPGGMSPEAALIVLFAVGLIAVPLVLLVSAATATRAFAGGMGDRGQVIRRFVFGLVPLGVGMWAAHYGFHLLTGFFVVVPVAQQAAIDLTGVHVLGTPLWWMTGLRSGAVFPIQLGLILLGTLGSFAVTQAIAERDRSARARRAVLPWWILIALLALVATWVMFQPMDMRGVGP